MLLIKKIKRLIYIIKIVFKRISKKPYRVFGHFTDSFGNNFDLLQGLRDDLKPGWQTMLIHQQKSLPSYQEVEPLLEYFKKRITKMNRLLDSCGLSAKQKSVLEIGCGDGLTSYLLLSNGAKSVTGSDIIAQEPIYINTIKKLVAKSTILTEKQTINVNLIKDNISSSRLPANCFDFICSFEVLEHLVEPEKAFVNMHRILKKDGVMFHEYNPFFCVTGGHSLCTLDFRWGHVRLNQKDFIKYLSEIRPKEKKLALDFYYKSLNRMTIDDLKRIIKGCGFQLLSLIMWPNEQDFNLIDHEILYQSQKNYPTLSISDLITPKIWILYKKL